MAGRIFMFFGLLALFGCGHPRQEVSFATTPQLVRDLDAIRARGYLEALVDNNSVSYFIYKGRSMGYEYELLKRLADHLKVELKIRLISGIDEAFDKLNRGEGDIIAFPLTITQERMQYASFTQPLFTTHQVLVQRKPSNWRRQLPLLTEKKMVRNPIELIGKEVHVLKSSSFKERLEHLSGEVGGQIIIHEDSANAESESLIRKVALGEIQFTVADQMMAQVNELYYPNIDVATVLSLPQQIAWATRTNAPILLEETNRWLTDVTRQGVFQVIHNRYFNSPRFSVTLVSSDYSSLNSGKLSPFDEQLKAGAKLLGWDWRLLASVVFQESNFDPQVESWAGAVGLMQVMPETGVHFGVTNLLDPQQNILVGVRFLKYLDDYWKKTVPDEDERRKFVLASYNVGLSHIIDAQKLSAKYRRKTDVWEGNVSYFLALKSEPKYYRDQVVAAGYCRCDGPVRYVKQVLQRFEEYKIHIAA